MKARLLRKVRKEVELREKRGVYYVCVKTDGFSFFAIKSKEIALSRYREYVCSLARTYFQLSIKTKRIK